jgi:ribosomal protein S18 acetylase RimI-like enzyme
VIRVEAVPPSCVDDELIAAVSQLLPQLSSSAARPSRAELEEIVSSAVSVLFVARETDRDGDPIVGMLTLVTYRIPTGLHAVIEDVVVDGAARNSGAGVALVQAALAEAEQRGAPDVNLTSRPSREAANRLYLKLGFKVRETNVYRFSPED